MDLLYKNHINTSTMFSINTGGSDGIDNVLSSDERFQYVSVGCPSDLAPISMAITFDSTVSISKIGLKGINWKNFMVYNAGNMLEYIQNNSETSIYLTYSQFYCTTLLFYVISTQVANEEKALGYVVASDVITNFGGKVPSAQKYRPIYRSKKIVHELSDGSYRSQVFDKKFGCDIQLDFVSSTVKDDLRDAYNNNTDFVFVPFGTTTGWDGVMFPCIWANDFEFFEVTDNNAAGGHSGSIKFLETRPA